MVNILIIQIF